MREWLLNEMHSIKKGIQEQFEEVEKNIWKQIPFEYTGLAYKFLYSLSDKLKLTDDYLEVGIISEVYGVDHGEFKSKLRKIVPTFSEDPDFK